VTTNHFPFLSTAETPPNPQQRRGKHLRATSQSRTIDKEERKENQSLKKEVYLRENASHDAADDKNELDNNESYTDAAQTIKERNEKKGNKETRKMYKHESLFDRDSSTESEEEEVQACTGIRNRG
jgi:hypothetical protein